MKTKFERLLHEIPSFDIDDGSRETLAAATRQLLTNDDLLEKAGSYYRQMYETKPLNRQMVWDWADPEADAVLGENLIFTLVILVRMLEQEAAGKYTYGDDIPVDFRYTGMRLLKTTLYRTGSLGMAASWRLTTCRYMIPEEFHLGRLAFEMTTFFFRYEVFRHRATAETLPIILDGERFDEAGFPHGEGNVVAARSESEGRLTGYTYRPDGRLDPAPVTLKLTEWERVLAPGDPVLSVHMPGNAKLAPEALDKSFADARVFMDKYYPDFAWRAFICSSWLLDTNLSKFVKPDSNMMKLQARFCIGLGFRNDFSLFDNVFDVPKKCTLEELVPTNRFQREILDMVKAGGTLYSGRGYILR